MVRSKKIEDIDIRIGEALRLLRINANRTQQDIAKHIGVAHQQWSLYESGGNKLSVSKLIMFCKFVRIDILEFLKAIDK